MYDELWSRLAIFAIVGKEPCVNNEWRPDGMTVVQQQGMEVLGVNLSPSLSFKDRYAVRPYVMLNAA